MCRLLGVISLLTCYFVGIKSANILFLSNVPSPSHGLWNFKLIGGLASRGHNVTALSPDGPKNIMKNVHFMSLADVYSRTKEDESLFSEFVDNNSFKIIKIYYELMVEICKTTSELDAFKTLLNYPDNFKFDLVIYDSTGGSCLLGFLHKFNYPPLIAVSAFKYTPDVVELMGGHSFPAYIPRAVGTYNVNMNLFQRVCNVFGVFYEIYYRRTVAIPGFDRIIQQHFHGAPTVTELEKKNTIALLNTNPATDFPVPMPPNIIEVGGLQIADPVPLPEDLETFLNKSTDGSVLISFGTNVHKDIFDEEQQNVIVGFARRFKNLNFLWKFEVDITNGKLPNLLVKPWLPQNDILAHPKLKVFITHCGGLSTQEATYHGVPMIAVPFFGDQFTNAQESVRAGVAVKVNIRNLTTDDLEVALRQIVEDSIFREKISLRSSRFRARPVKPLDEAIWWIEYILRDPNPVHIKSPVLSLGHFKANCLDLILYLEIFLIALFFGAKLMISKLQSLMSSPQIKRKIKNK